MAFTVVYLHACICQAYQTQQYTRSQQRAMMLSICPVYCMLCSHQTSIFLCSINMAFWKCWMGCIYRVLYTTTTTTQCMGHSHSPLIYLACTCNAVKSVMKIENHWLVVFSAVFLNLYTGGKPLKIQNKCFPAVWNAFYVCFCMQHYINFLYGSCCGPNTITGCATGNTGSQWVRYKHGML